ncbi:FAD-containing subunit of NADH dehydrogenase [Xylariaceae sp. FL0016]|nr:FAD-containing subunit of NADH dehydrogenase [Xylariaceae sp. FL0016]
MSKIVIVGSGFAGLWAALSAGRLINLSIEKGMQEASNIELYEAEPANMVVPLDDLFNATGIKFIQGIVTSIGTESRELSVASNSGMTPVLAYDRLVQAAGSQAIRPAILGLDDYAYSVDHIEDAIKLHEHLDSLTSLQESRARDTVVVCGGGFAGIGTAAELPWRMRSVLGHEAHVRVVVVDREKHIGPDLGPNPRPAIEAALKDLKVEMKLGSPLAGIDADGVVLASGERIETLTAVWAAGHGRLIMDTNLRVPTVETVFVCGDAAFAATGRIAGHNAAADLLGLPAIPYRQPYYGTCLDLGPESAVLTEGWDCVVRSNGAEAKVIKRYVNGTIIYSPKADARVAFAAADPAFNDPDKAVNIPTLKGFIAEMEAAA